MKTTIIKLVRNFGPVGGLENYVWETIKSILDKDYNVVVICNKDYGNQTHPNLTVYESLIRVIKPRWVEALLYSNYVEKTLRTLDVKPNESVIFSHERHWNHDYSVFHGSPYANTRGKPWFKKISIRHFVNVWLEQQQVISGVRKGVIPVSEMLSSDLKHYFDHDNIKIANVIPPAVRKLTVSSFTNEKLDKKIIGFIGYEWKRKGLIFAIQILEKLLSINKDWEFWVISKDTKSVEKKVPAKLKHKIKFLGISNQVGNLLNQFDLLLHPAKAEPYGMVITEALSMKVPVVISDKCGAAQDVTEDRGDILSLKDSDTTWAIRINERLKDGYRGVAFQRDWDTVADEYLSLIKK
tara:strand:+ start:600 stop:1658 length:1059 start_codon:yes stop_codon:yes gene_type:complete